LELQVYHNTTIKEVKEKFSRFFPFLKVEFFLYHRQTEDTPSGREIYKGRYLEETSEFFKEGTICFSPGTSIAQLEQEFQIELGIYAKIYRKSVENWVDTTQTSHLSLAKQNNMGGAVMQPRLNIHTLFL